MPVWEANIIDSDFVHQLPEPAVTFAGRRFLLVPIEGSAGQPEFEKNQSVRLEPLKMSDFTDENGWAKGAQEILSHMDLGDSIKQFDGIGQAQVVIRVV